MHNDKINSIKKELENIFDGVKTTEKLEQIKAEYMGKNGKITTLNSLIREVPNEEKKEFGMQVNELKDLFNTKYTQIKEEIEEAEINAKLNKEAIDVTLPGTD